jgi:hypothetical protein
MAARHLDFKHPNDQALENELNNQLCVLRQGPCGEKIRCGLKKVGEIDD